MINGKNLNPLRASWRLILLLALIMAITACGTSKKKGAERIFGYGDGNYKNDGPPVVALPIDLNKIPDAIPKVEPLHSGANKPYKIKGRTYTPRTRVAAFRERGIASWYGKAFHGRPTSNGETYNMYAMTAAHPTLPIPSYIRVTNVTNGRSVVVRVNDRGPFHGGRIVDLSYAAAYKLDYINAGSVDVTVEQIVPGVFQADPVASAPAATIKGYFLQLGAFGSRPNADKFVENIRKAASAVARQVDISQDGKVYRVFAGPFSSQDEARSAADALSRLNGLYSFVVQR